MSNTAKTTKGTVKKTMEKLGPSQPELSVEQQNRMLIDRVHELEQAIVSAQVALRSKQLEQNATRISLLIQACDLFNTSDKRRDEMLVSIHDALIYTGPETAE